MPLPKLAYGRSSNGVVTFSSDEQERITVLHKKTVSLIALTVLSLGALTACGSDNANPSRSENDSASSGLRGTLTGTGASSQGSAMDVWKSAFTSAHRGAQVQYSPDGSGAGRKALLGGAAQFAGSDAYLTAQERQSSTSQCGAGGAIDVPVYISPIAVAYNLPQVRELVLDASTIARIFRGEITHWNEAPIVALNPEASLPDIPITAVHRSDNSGTTENFTDYLSQAAPDVWRDAPGGEWPGGLGGENAKGTSGVVRQVDQTQGALTYADASAVGTKLSTARLKISGEAVALSQENAARAAETAKRQDGRPEHDIALNIDRTPQGVQVYPLILVSYHVYCTSYPNKEVADLVKAFASYVVSPQGQDAAADAAHNVPLPSQLAQQAQDAVGSITAAS